MILLILIPRKEYQVDRQITVILGAILDRTSISLMISERDSSQLYSTLVFKPILKKKENRGIWTLLRFIEENLFLLAPKKKIEFYL